jgi:hypothetical protein
MQSDGSWVFEHVPYTIEVVVVVVVVVVAVVVLFVVAHADHIFFKVVPATMDFSCVCNTT